MINPSLHNSVRYTLTYGDLSFVVSEPLEWRSESVDFERHADYHGIFGKVTDSIVFTGEGAQFIRDIYSGNGANVEITLLKEIIHPTSGLWVDEFEGVLDLTELVDESKKVSVKINSDGLLTTIKSRFSEKLEIERFTTLKDETLDKLPTETLALDGRRIFLVSLNTKTDGWDDVEFTMIDVGTPPPHMIECWICPLSDLTSQSDEQFHAVIQAKMGEDGFDLSGIDGDVGNMFYIDSDQAKTIRVSIKINQDVKFTNNTIPSSTKGLFTLNLYKFDTGDTFANPTVIETLATVLVDKNTDTNINFDGYYDVDLLVGESLALAYHVQFDYAISESTTSFYSTDSVYNLTVEEDSYFPKSDSKIVMAHELGERLVNIIGGEFKSNLLGRTDVEGHNYQIDGDFALKAFASGHWIRRFNLNNDLYKPFTTSLKDYFDSLNVLKGIGIMIEKNGFNEVVRLEEKEFFYQNFVGINLGKVANIKRTVAKERYYSSLEIGFKEPKGDNLYEEAMGLDEYNTKTNWTTPITRVDKKLKLLSPYRADSYGEEFARRKQVSTDPTKDTRYDKHIWVQDVAREDNAFIQVKDYLDELPTGVFSPETATNLRFTPSRLLLNHAKWIKPCMRWNLDDKIMYSSSEGNSNLSTVKDGITVKENENINISDLDQSRFYPEWIEFEKPIDISIKEQIEGETNGVKNLYGLVEFENEYGQKERGYLFKINGNKNFKLLKV